MVKLTPYNYTDKPLWLCSISLRQVFMPPSIRLFVDGILNSDLNSLSRYVNRVLSLNSLRIDFSAFISLSCLGLDLPFSSYVTSLKKHLCFTIQPVKRLTHIFDALP